ncbi:ricin-type beta-trefoil lectin domain protein [Embleya sp. AB8]|uniref:ricin-type beta-trefoil lectin domain protein n=1 Tax=Embleya sp. AB8 TaxID=3156304 RepID=UPI003C74B771
MNWIRKFAAVGVVCVLSLATLVLSGAPASAVTPTANRLGPIFSASNSRLCMDAAGGNSGNGTSAQVYTCNRSDAQKWTIHADGTLRVLGKCLDIPNGGTATATPLQLWDCTDGAPGQQWKAYSSGELVNPNSGRCIDAGVGAPSIQLRIQDCTMANYQRWVIPHGGRIVFGYNDLCLDIAGGQNVDGTKVQLWDCNLSSAQLWSLIDGRIMAAPTETSHMCLDVAGGGTGNNTKVQVWSCVPGGVPAQKWVQDANGHLINPASGRCLRPPNPVGTKGEQLEIFDCANDTPWNVWKTPFDVETTP